MKTYAFRLTQGMDLRKEIDGFVSKYNIQAGCILTCIGGMEKVILRMTDTHEIKELEGNLEIISLAGTLEAGNSHLHISLADKQGNVIAGHLKNGSIVGITAEIVIGELENTIFNRVYDESTGYEELVVETDN